MRPATRFDRERSLGRFGAAILTALLGACGGGDATPPAPVVMETISGKVFEAATIAGALVCLDADNDGRCTASDPQARTGSDGAYQLSVPKGATSMLIAQVGPADGMSAPAGTRYRMTSPAYSYSKNITPLTTMVQLTGERNFALAEDLAREVVGLPPMAVLRLDAPPATGTLSLGVIQGVTTALKASDASLNLASPEAMKQVTASFPATLTDLPQLRIVTKDNAPITSTEIYVDATYTLLTPAVSPDPVTLNGKIRGRGHSTWGQPKNPYKVQFTNDAAYAAVGEFLGMPKNRNWALLADWFDRSLLRNKLAFSLGSSTVFASGLKWTPSGQHLEVWLNGDYVGVYLLTEDIRIDPARLNIRKMSKKAADNQVDGGYIVEVDARLDCYKGDDLNLQHVTAQGVPICIDTPDEEDITTVQLAWIKNLLDTVEQELYATARSARVNPVSFVDWYLLSELFRNHDSQFYSSVFMWKDTEGAAIASDRLLNLGPLWDFDRSAGNIDYGDCWLSEGCWVGKAYRPNWIAKMLEDPSFVNLAIARWKEKRPTLATFINTSLDTFVWRLDAAQKRNFQRWPILGTPGTGHYTFQTYAEEVAFLKRFLNDRMAWLDKVFETPESFDRLCR